MTAKKTNKRATKTARCAGSESGGARGSTNRDGVLSGEMVLLQWSISKRLRAAEELANDLKLTLEEIKTLRGRLADSANDRMSDRPNHA